VKRSAHRRPVIRATPATGQDGLWNARDKHKARRRVRSAGLYRLSVVLLLALDCGAAAIVNAGVPARHWLHSPAKSLVAVGTASSNSSVVGVARIKTHNVVSGKSPGADYFSVCMKSRRPTPNNVVLQVLTEAGYRCAVPTCRNILAIDLHHIMEVVEGGGNETANLLALCPTCHALFHRGTIKRESIYAWKLILISLSRAFDVSAIDDLLFLSNDSISNLGISGDGVLKFSRLIAAGLAEFHLMIQNGPLVLYQVALTAKGHQLIDAWTSGNRQAVAGALGGG
jgi:HNH endonuclease